MNWRPLIAGLFPSLLALAALSIGGCAGGAAPPDPLAADAAALAQSLQPLTVSDNELSGYLRDIGERLSAAAQQSTGRKPPAPDFRLAGAKGLGVATLGTGPIFVTPELIQRARSEDELAAVLAHAYAHHVARHVRPMTGNVIPGIARELPEHIVLDAATHPFTPEQENKATELGYELYARGGWNPDNFSGPGFRAGQGTPSVKLPTAARDWRQRPIADPRAFANYQQKAQRLTATDPRAERLFAALPSCVVPADPAAQKRAAEQIRAELMAAPVERHGVRRGLGNVQPGM